MFRRAAASLSVAALSTAGLLAAAPLAQAAPAPAPVPTDDTTGALIDDLTLLPVQACGLDVGVPILSDILGGTDGATDAACAIVDDGADDD